jgi:hypothetical protein
METQPEETNQEEIARQEGVTPQVSGENVQLDSGVAGRVAAGRDVTMTSSVAGIVAAGQDMQMVQSNAGMVAVGRDMQVVDSNTFLVTAGGDIQSKDSIAVLLNAGGDVEMVDCVAPILVCRQVTAEDSVLGLVLSRQTNLGEGSRVLLNTPQAVALGAAFGAAFALLTWLLKRK